LRSSCTYFEGAAATLGGHHAKQACLRFETIVRAGDIHVAHELVSIVRREVNVLEDALRDFFEIENKNITKIESVNPVDINVLRD